MKTLNITFTDEEFKKLCKAKAEDLYIYTWHDFVIEECTKKEIVKRRFKK